MLKAGPRGTRKDERLAIAGLVIAALAAAVFLIWEGRGLTFQIDEWFFGYGLRSGHDLSAFFMPHNGHLVLVPVLITKVALQLFGVGSALPLRLLSVAVHIAVGVSLYFLLRGPLGKFAALAPTSLVLFLGAANDAFIGSHGLALTLSVATGFCAWLALRRRQTAWDGVAAGLLTVGVCSNGYALPFTAGAIAIIVLDRDSPRSRLWVPAVPLFVYGLWWLIEGRHAGQFAIANIGGLPSFVFDSLGASLAVITGVFTAPGTRSVSFDIPAGQALAGACLVALLALVLGRRYRPPRAAIPAIVALLSFWLLTAVSADFARQPNSSRYLYVSVVLVLLVMAELLAGSRVRRDGALALGAICLFALLPNLREITYAAHGFREQSDINRAVLGAADLVTGQSPGDTILETPDESEKGNYQDLIFSFDQYIAARDRFGTPAFSPAEIYRAQPNARAAADRLLVRALPISVEATAQAPRPLPPNTNESQTGGAVKPIRGCLRFVPLAPGAQINLALPPGGLWMRPGAGTPVPIGLRHFADTFETTIGPALAGHPSLIDLSLGRASANWLVQLTPEQPVLICAA